MKHVLGASFVLLSILTATLPQRHLGASRAEAAQCRDPQGYQACVRAQGGSACWETYCAPRSGRTEICTWLGIDCE